MFSPRACSTNEHDELNSVVWGRTRRPALSSCQSGFSFSRSFTPRCHQLARSEVSLRHWRCRLLPSVTSLIISWRLVFCLTHRDKVENTAHTHNSDTKSRRKVSAEDSSVNRSLVFMCTNTSTLSHVWIQTTGRHSTVFCSDDYTE